MRKTHLLKHLLLGLLLALAGAAGCAGGLELLLTPTSIRIRPGLTTAAPGEVVNYTIRMFSIFGTEIPATDEVGAWTVSQATNVPEGLTLPEGEFEAKSVGVIDNRGRLEASPVVAPGHYRVGVVRAEIWGSFGSLTASTHVVVDGNIDENAPSATVYPEDVRVPIGVSVPFGVLCIDSESGRVVTPCAAEWSVLEGGGAVDSSGVYTAPDAKVEEVRVSVKLETGRTALTYLTVDDRSAGGISKAHIAPAVELKIGLGQAQRFIAYGTDGDGRFIAGSDAVWIVEGGIGELTVLEDGSAQFLARAAGQGAISVRIGEKEARQKIIAVIPGV